MQNTLLSLLSLVIFVLLLGYFTKRRAERFGAKGYGYGQCLGFRHGQRDALRRVYRGSLHGRRLQLALCGQIRGDDRSVIAMLENTGFYTGDQIEMMMKLMRSPLVQLFSGMLLPRLSRAAFSVCLLLPSPSRDPDVFSEGTNQ